MGAVALPISGIIYLDAQAIIYSVEKHARYEPMLRPLWIALKAGSVRIVTSELSLLEVLVGPYKSGDLALASSYETLLGSQGIAQIPIQASVLKQAAQLKAQFGLRTPDAIHVATAIAAQCTSCVGNDAGFKSVAALNFVMLDDLLSASP